MTLEPAVYRFYARAEDGIRLYVDGNLVLDEWHAGAGDNVYTVELSLGGEHRLVVEYYERTDAALVKLWWKWAGDWPTPTLTPTHTPTPTATPTMTSAHIPTGVRPNEIFPVPATRGCG